MLTPNLQIYLINETQANSNFMVLILQVTVTDVNDNKAQFSATSYHFSVNENLDEGVVVAQITASDLDYGINGKFIEILLMKLKIYFDVKNKNVKFKE